MNKILLTCLSATLLGASCSTTLFAQSGAESFNDMVAIFKDPTINMPPELFLSPLTYSSQSGTFSGVSFTVDGTSTSITAKFMPTSGITSLEYQWLLPSQSMTYSNAGALTLTGTNNIVLNPSSGITIGGYQVLTSASGLPLVPGSLKVGSGNSITGSNSVALGLGTSAYGDQLVIGRYNNPSATSNGPLDVLFIIGGGTSGLHKDALSVRADGTMKLGNRLVVGTQSTNEPEWIMGANTLSAGLGTYAKADASAALGFSAFAMSPGAIAAGYQVRAGGTSVATLAEETKLGPTAFGVNTWAKNLGDMAFGHGTEASGVFSTAGGYTTKASGPASVSIGNASLATGHSSVALGMSNEAKGENSAALGTGLKAKGKSQTALGRYNIESGTEDSNPPTDNLLIVGNGVPGQPKNALTIQHNGNVNAAGVIRVWRAGDISMGAFKSGPRPNIGTDPDPAP